MKTKASISGEALGDYGSERMALRLIDSSHRLVTYYNKEYELPIDHLCKYIYLGGVIGCCRYYKSGLWFVDVAVHKNIRGREGLKKCKILLSVFAKLFYVLGYIGIIEKNNKPAQINARWCGFKYIKDIIFENKNCSIYLRMEKWV